MVQQESKNQEDIKLKMEIFVPLNVCACQWETFMNLVFRVITKYNKYVEFETKNLNSEEARKLNLHGNSVVVDGDKIFTTAFMLEKKLPELLKEKGLT